MSASKFLQGNGGYKPQNTPIYPYNFTILLRNCKQGKRLFSAEAAGFMNIYMERGMKIRYNGDRKE